VYNPKKLLGVTTLDVVRANTFVAQVSTASHGTALQDFPQPSADTHASCLHSAGWSAANLQLQLQRASAWVQQLVLNVDLPGVRLCYPAGQGS
jgi:hypothetical protein